MFCVCFLLSREVLGVLSNFTSIPVRKGELVALIGCFNCLLDKFVCKWHMALPRGAVGGSAMPDCGISWSYSLTF